MNPTTHSPPDAGLWKRGLVLFVFVALLSAVVLYVLLRRPESVLSPAPETRPEQVLLLVAQPGSGFPASVSWGALYQLIDSSPSSPGWETRYNATLTQARKGSADVRLEVLAEMLDESRQLRNFRSKLQDGRDVPDEAAAGRTILNALKAFSDWHKKIELVQKVEPKSADLQRVYAALDALTHSSNQVLRTEAEKTRKALGRG